jgi:uncharacterized protein (UPF0248 family)
MQNIRDLLNKIKWDPAEEKKKDKYQIYYYDALRPELVELSFSQIIQIDSFGITTLDDTYIPLHRIRKVCFEDKAIWSRETKSQ